MIGLREEVNKTLKFLGLLLFIVGLFFLYIFILFGGILDVQHSWQLILSIFFIVGVYLFIEVKTEIISYMYFVIREFFSEKVIQKGIIFFFDSILLLYLWKFWSAVFEYYRSFGIDVILNRNYELFLGKEDVSNYIYTLVGVMFFSSYRFFLKDFKKLIKVVLLLFLLGGWIRLVTLLLDLVPQFVMIIAYFFISIIFVLLWNKIRFYYERDYKAINYFGLYKKVKFSQNALNSNFNIFKKLYVPVDLYYKYKGEVNASLFNIPNRIRLNLDEPIVSQYDDEDILGHKEYAKNIFDLIYYFDMRLIKKSYTIGLVGEWGIGKTGILNMVKNDWIEGREDMIFYEFSPWNYGKDDLISKFFTDLAHHLDITNFNSKIQKYLKLIGSIEKIKGYSWLSDVFGLLFPEKTLDEIKKQINTKLEQYDKKIIVSIDDLDRCEPDEIMTMLNLVKNLGNFKNIIYIVSYDKENVLNVIKEKKFLDNYLDKIINTEVYIPTPTSKQVQDFFVKGLENIFKSLNLNDNDFIINKINCFKDTVNYYDINNKHEFDSNINGIFEKENLRFIKKLLNQINIVFQSNFKNINDFKNINGLGDSEYLKKLEIDLNTIVLLNYIKLKHYKYYYLLFKIGREVAQNKPVTLNQEEELLFKSHMEFLKYEFLTYISGIYNSTTGEGGSFRKRSYVKNLSLLLNDIEKYS